MPHPLDGCQAKLDRAREHIEALRAAEHDYFGGDERPFNVDRHFDPSTNLYYFIGRVTQAPPLRLGVILGDIVHDLRSALDHLVWQLVLAAGNDPEREPWPMFVVCSQRAAWDKARDTRKGLLRAISAEAAARIRRVQPFVTHPSNPALAPLHRLHNLWNHDKHRLVTPTAAALGAVHGGVAFVRSPVNSEQMKLTPVQDVDAMHEPETFTGVPIDGQPIVQVRISPSGPNPVIELAGSAIGGLAFDDCAPVNYTIAEMGTQVDDIVSDFRRDWPH